MLKIINYIKMEKRNKIINYAINLAIKSIPHNFIKERKYDLKICKELKLGYLDSEDYNTLLNEFNKEDLIEVGFIKNKQYTFQNFVIIPISDNYFSVKPSNVSIPGTKKPYIINKNKEDIIICEGETDAIALRHIFSDKKIIALRGVTSQKPLENIKNKKVLICFDNDKAGKKALSKALSILKDNNNIINIIKFNKKYKDIDELFRDKQKETEDFLVIEEPNFNKIKKTKTKNNNNNEWIDFISFKSDKKYPHLDQEIKIGKKIRCLNPDHKDKNPSMHIYNNRCKCFSCGYVLNNPNYKSKLNGLDIQNYQSNVKDFWQLHPFFYDKSKIFWFWNENEYKFEIVDETDLMIDLDERLSFNGETVNKNKKAQYIEAFKRVGRMNHPKETPISWIQFKDTIVDIKDGSIKKVTPKYFFTNPIPYKLGEKYETPVMDKLFEEWVGKKYVKTLYEIIAYCCYRGYPIQVLFSFCGSGRNGKSQFIKIIDKFIGKDNCASTELDLLLNNRFETFKLFKKLVCMIGETNFGILNKSSILKKLTGGDKIGFEKKNKDPFDEYNYAKPIIASNSLPSSDDTSDGFYRRWIIINFPNEFPEGKDIIETIPEIEYNNLAKKITEILPKLLQRGKFTNQGTIVERKKKYIEMSNPFALFIEKYCLKEIDYYVSYNKLYTQYIQYLQNNKKRAVKYKEFKTALQNEGLFIERTTLDGKNGLFIIGIKLKNRNEIENKEDKPSLNEKEREVIRFITMFDKDNLDKACKFFGSHLIEEYLKKGILYKASPNTLKEL